MSVLETPRIYFRGQVSWDPIVTNNRDRFYDEKECLTLPQPVDLTAFRQKTIEALGDDGVWNLDGTHRSSFFESSVSGADVGQGVYENDPFAGSPANFAGMLVDLETYGSITSQLFFDGMSFGIAGGYRIAARRRTRFTARYLNFNRNSLGPFAGIASVVWQTCFANEDVQIDTFDSPALRALDAARKTSGVRGLTVQWNAYRTTYYNSPEAYDPAVRKARTDEMIAKLKSGGFQPNPAHSLMVGVIGLWRDGEPVHQPGDRVLIPGASLPRPPKPAITTIHARVADHSLTLDLSNSIGEDGLSISHEDGRLLGPKKHDFGDLTIQTISSSPLTLGTLKYTQYDLDAYLRTSGIVTLPLKDTQVEAARNSNLTLLFKDGKEKWLNESEAYAVPLVPNLYVNEGDKPTLSFQVYRRGEPTEGGWNVRVYILSYEGRKETIRELTDPNQLPTSDSDGIVHLRLDNRDYPAPAVGLTAYVAIVFPWEGVDEPTKGIDTQKYNYMFLRVLPADDDIAKKDPTWKNVYDHVLSNWHAMAPCMANWLNLGDEAQVRSFAPMIKDLTAEKNFESFRYMPVTRDLTRGARTLLYKFLDAKVTVSAESPDTAAEELSYFTRLSRTMR